MLPYIVYEPISEKSVRLLSGKQIHSPATVIVYDHITDNVLFTQKLPEPHTHSLALSTVKSLLATGYWWRKGIDIWDYRKKVHVCSFGPSKVHGLLFDAKAQYIMIDSENGTFIYDIAGNLIDKLKFVNDYCFATLDFKNNVALVSNTRKGKLHKVNFHDKKLDIKEIILPTDSIAYDLEFSNVKRCYLIIAKGKMVYLFSEDDELIWKKSLKNYCGNKDDSVTVAQFSGNGKLIGVIITKLKGWDTVVIDSQTGEVVDIYVEFGAEGYPYKDNQILSPRGEILDLATGKNIGNLIEKYL